MSLIILTSSLFAGKHLRNTRANLESLKPRKSSIFRGKDKETITLITFTFTLAAKRIGSLMSITLLPF